MHYYIPFTHYLSSLVFVALAFEALVRFSSNSGAKRMSFLFFLEARDEEKDGAAEISQYSYPSIHTTGIYIHIYV